MIREETFPIDIVFRDGTHKHFDVTAWDLSGLPGYVVVVDLERQHYFPVDVVHSVSVPMMIDGVQVPDGVPAV